MPKNRFLYAGVLIIAATALLFLGHELTTLTMPLLPWTLGAGVGLMLLGVFLEARHGKDNLKLGIEAGEPLITMPEETATATVDDPIAPA